MSIEIYRCTDAGCDGVCSDHDEHLHWYECQFGVIEHGDPRPDRREVGHIMLTTPSYLSSLVTFGPRTWERKGGRVDSASVHDDRAFIHCDWQSRRWTWELFDAYFRDKPHFEVLIGRWPD